MTTSKQVPIAKGLFTRPSNHDRESIRLAGLDARFHAAGLAAAAGQTGIALQLREDAGQRQVPGSPRVGHTHVYGAPGLSGVTVLAR